MIYKVKRLMERHLGISTFTEQQSAEYSIKNSCIQLGYLHIEYANTKANAALPFDLMMYGDSITGASLTVTISLFSSPLY